jgi:YjjG family noncanonical pyrimidine nucleotidase
MDFSGVKAVLLDIDNTLLDFNKCATECIRLAFEKFNLEFNDQTFSVFKKINDALWLEIENRTLTKKELHQVRFNRVLNALGLEYDGWEVEQEFLSNLKECAIPVDGALDVVKYLSEKYVLCTASNSFYNQQVKRLTTAGIYKYVDNMFISEVIGYEKPSNDFFRECLKRLNIEDKSQVVMIGDSLTADIKGGKDFGITTIWFNPENQPKTDDCDIVINNLEEIKKYL